MPLTNWYPAGAPSWPPPGFTFLEWSDLDSMESWVRAMKRVGLADIDNPTVQERNAYFTPTLCAAGHPVTGRMLVIAGNRYPFARCNSVDHREFLVAWPPFTWGSTL